MSLNSSPICLFLTTKNRNYAEKPWCMWRSPPSWQNRFFAIEIAFRRDKLRRWGWAAGASGPHRVDPITCAREDDCVMPRQCWSLLIKICGTGASLRSGSIPSITGSVVITAAHARALSAKNYPVPHVDSGGTTAMETGGWLNIRNHQACKQTPRDASLFSIYAEGGGSQVHLYRIFPPVGWNHLWIKVSNIQSPLKRPPEPRLREMTRLLCFFPTKPDRSGAL